MQMQIWWPSNVSVTENKTLQIKLSIVTLSQSKPQLLSMVSVQCNKQSHKKNNSSCAAMLIPNFLASNVLVTEKKQKTISINLMINTLLQGIP